jgi:hypothetical protein
VPPPRECVVRRPKPTKSLRLPSANTTNRIATVRGPWGRSGAGPADARRLADRGVWLACVRIVSSVRVNYL